MTLDIFIGLSVSVPTETLIDVVLIIEKIEENILYKNIQITPDTPENDWYGQSTSYHELSYIVKFTNGYSKVYEKINDIKLVTLPKTEI